MKRRCAAGVLATAIALGACSKEPASQPVGYVVVEQDAHCAVRIDGKPWKHAVHERGSVTAGPHRVECVDEAGHPRFVRELTVVAGSETPIFWGP